MAGSIMAKPSKTQSVFSEPHMMGDDFTVDKSEKIVSKKFASRKAPTTEQIVEHTIWDEPALSGELVPEIPASALTYKKWYIQESKKTTLSKSWIMTFLLTFASGPWAVIGVFVLAFQGLGGYGAAAVVIFGPLMEEVLKITSALIVVEKRPFLFSSARQIFICCFCSGLVFSFIENLIYLNFYVANPTPQLIIWRWSVCVILHSTCSAIASFGLIQMWKESKRDFSKPKAFYMIPPLFVAVLIHGIYNSVAIFLAPFFK